MYYPKITGERVYLSPIQPDDAVIYTRWLNDPEVTLGLGSHHRVFSEMIEKATLEQMAQNQDEVSLAIVLLSTDRVIGNCGLMDIDHLHRKANLGIFIGDKAYRNSGYGTEAMALLLDFGFRVLNLHNINLKYFSFNVRGENAYRKLGFKEIGRRREAVRYNGRYYDDVEMDMLEDEFRGGLFCDVNKWELDGYEF